MTCRFEEPTNAKRPLTRCTQPSATGLAATEEELGIAVSKRASPCMGIRLLGPDATWEEAWPRDRGRDPAAGSPPAALGGRGRARSRAPERPRSPVGVERFGLALGSIQRQHQLPPASLPQRFLTDHALQLGDERSIGPEASSASTRSSTADRRSSSSLSSAAPKLDVEARSAPRRSECLFEDHRGSIGAALGQDPAASYFAARSRARRSRTSRTRAGSHRSA